MSRGPKTWEGVWSKNSAGCEVLWRIGLEVMAKTFTKTKAKTKSSHAQRALADTRQLAESITEWTALVNAVFGPGGVLSRHVKTQSARVAFSKSKEFAAIWDMINQRQRAAAA